MSIATEITRLQGIKADIRLALLAGGIASGTHNMEDFAADIIKVAKPIQIVKDGDFPTGSTNWGQSTSGIIQSVVDGKLTAYFSAASNRVRTVNYTVGWVQNHKYYCFCYAKPNAFTQVKMESAAGWKSFTVNTEANVDTLVSGIIEPTATATSSSSNYLQIFVSTAPVTVELSYVNVIDLTETFGSGNEPDLATCRRIFDKYIYPYNPPTA